MKAAISAYQNDLSAQINPRFGRCDYLLIVDTEDMGFEAFVNENKSLSSGAGIQTASFVISKGVDCVLTGECGPNAMGIFRTANIDVYAGQTGSVMDAVNRLKQGNLKPSAGAGNADASLNRPAQGRGMGGRGMGGRGCGGGMGQGRGGGCGMGRRG